MDRHNNLKLQVKGKIAAAWLLNQLRVSVKYLRRMVNNASGRIHQIKSSSSTWTKDFHPRTHQLFLQWSDKEKQRAMVTSH